jgi:hypothetical protein
MLEVPAAFFQRRADLDPTGLAPGQLEGDAGLRASGVDALSQQVSVFGQLATPA